MYERLLVDNEYHADRRIIIEKNLKRNSAVNRRTKSCGNPQPVINSQQPGTEGWLSKTWSVQVFESSLQGSDKFSQDKQRGVPILKDSFVTQGTQSRILSEN